MGIQKYYTREEVAKMLKVDVRTIDRWRKMGLIKSIKIGKTRRFSEAQVLRLIEQQKSE